MLSTNTFLLIIKKSFILAMMKVSKSKMRPLHDLWSRTRVLAKDIPLLLWLKGFNHLVMIVKGIIAKGKFILKMGKSVKDIPPLWWIKNFNYLVIEKGIVAQKKFVFLKMGKEGWCQSYITSQSFLAYFLSMHFGWRSWHLVIR